MFDPRRPPVWLHVLAWSSIIVALLCGAAIALDILGGRRQKMAVMNIVWPVTGLYFGPIALWAYWAFGRGKRGKRKRFAEQVFTGATHCGAGCTLGDFAGEWIVFLGGVTIAGSVLWADYAADFTLAYLLGIVFQYFAIAPMRNLSGWPGIAAAMKADTISLVAFEVGMFGWMAFAGEVLFQPRPEPTQMVYWFSMQIAMVAGFAFSYPANWWLIRAGIKEAM